MGKTQFYLASLDDRVRMDDVNPSVGIIPCKSKDRTIVEYALRESNKPIRVAAYRLDPGQVARLLEEIVV